MSSSLTASAPKDGLIVQQEDAGVACQRSGCDSRWVPLNNLVLWPSGEGCSLTRRRSGVRVPPGLLAQRCLDTPTGRATRLKPECLRVRILLWALNNKTRLGRQLADHFGLEPEMLRVRIPPELLEINTSSWSSGVLACLSRRRSSVQIRSGVLRNMARYANPAERRISNVRGCGFDSLPCYLNDMRRLGIGRPRWP